MKKNILLILSNKDVKSLFQIFRHSGFEIRYVGGCVRDALLRKKSHDIDFSTNARPHEMQQILKKNHVHYFDSGLKHGTITAIFHKTCYEITTLRYDTECDGRHAKVEYTKSWELDAERRDFTFNALYCDESGKIYDYFDGIKDLENKKLRFIGDCRKRIEEDYLRILRAFRFNNRYCDGKFDDEIIQSFSEMSFGIGNLSGERIQQEIIKLISEIQKENIEMLNFFNQTNISKFVFDKNIDFHILNSMIEYGIQNSWLRLGIIFRYNDISYEWIKNRWNLSKANSSLLKKIYELKLPNDLMEMENQYFFLHSEIQETFLFCCMYENCISIKQYEKLKEKWSYKEQLFLPITNQDVMRLGLNGRMIGESLKFIESEWLKSNCELRKEDLISILEERKNTL